MVLSWYVAKLGEWIVTRFPIDPLDRSIDGSRKGRRRRSNDDEPIVGNRTFRNSPVRRGGVSPLIHQPILEGSSIESTKTSRRGENGTKRIVTRIVRKTTTLTRGEERCVAEDLTKRAASGYLQDTAASSSSFSLSRQASPKPKTVRVSATHLPIFALPIFSTDVRGLVVVVFVPRFALLFVARHLRISKGEPNGYDIIEVDASKLDILF